jgi:hypothetical protein
MSRGCVERGAPSTAETLKASKADEGDLASEANGGVPTTQLTTCLVMPANATRVRARQYVRNLDG